MNQRTVLTRPVTRDRLRDGRCESRAARAGAPRRAALPCTKSLFWFCSNYPLRSVTREAVSA